MMIRSVQILFFSALFLLFFAFEPVALAGQANGGDKAPQPAVPLSTVLQNLKMNGYEIISKVELEKGVYKVEALTPQGKELSVKVDASNSEIISPKQNPIPPIGLSEAVKRVEGSGYHAISKVKYSDGKYIIKALDEHDKKVKLKVDGKTGEITKAWF